MGLLTGALGLGSGWMLFSTPPPRQVGACVLPAGAIQEEVVVAAVACRSGLSKVQAATVLQHTLRVVEEGMLRESEVDLGTFGAFSVSTRRGFEGHNPKTGEPMTIPRVRIAVFRAGDGLKQALNE